MSTPVQTTTAAGPAKPGPIDDRDVAEWKDRVNECCKKPGEVINSKSAPDARPWHTGLFDCFNPIDTCFMSWCLPCVVFGRTHHRLRKNGSLEGWEPVNTSCLLFCASSCIGFPVLPLMAMQRADVRAKYNLEGDCITDLLLSCCCGCCTIAQADKEAAHQEPLLAQGVKEQYEAPQGMTYPTQ